MKRIHTLLIALTALFFANITVAENLDPNIHYVHKGQHVKPWELTLQFGKVQLENGAAKTTKGNLVVKPATREADNDALHAKWSKRLVKNEWGTEDKSVSTLTVINKLTTVDLTPVVEQAALVFDVKVLKAPNKNVELMMECNWDWKCRTTIPLKKVLKKLPKKQWVSVPIPLKCLRKDDFDFSKVTSIFTLYTGGSMELELGEVGLSAYPADKVKC